MADYGWIKLHRELLLHPIWQNSTPEQKTVLVALLCMANHKQNKWEWMGKEYDVQAGQFITSLDSIVKACGKGVTIQNVRTAINRFERFGFLTNESTKTGRLITIENWHKWQTLDDQPNKASNRKTTDNQQRPNKELTPNKNVENEKKDIVEIVSHLNEVCGTNYGTGTKETQRLISARMRDGFKLDDFIKVIDIKAAEWLNDNKMKSYLRPQTLFGTKFEAYLNQGAAGSGQVQRKVTTHEEIEAKKAEEVQHG